MSGENGVPAETPPEESLDEKQKFLKVIGDWMDDPGRATKLSIEVLNGMNQQRQPIRRFEMRMENVHSRLDVIFDTPKIITAPGPLANPQGPRG